MSRWGSGAGGSEFLCVCRGIWGGWEFEGWCWWAYECHLFLLRPVGCYTAPSFFVFLTAEDQTDESRMKTRARICTDQSVQYTHTHTHTHTDRHCEHMEYAAFRFPSKLHHRFLHQHRADPGADCNHTPRAKTSVHLTFKFCTPTFRMRENVCHLDETFSLHQSNANTGASWILVPIGALLFG